jgi:hypothetical protein
MQPRCLVSGVATQNQQTVLDLFVESFGDPPSSRLAKSIERRMQWRRLADFGERFRAFEQEVRAPVLKPGELRPYVPYMTGVPGASLSIRSLPSDEYQDELAAGLDALRHHLLYCHSIAMDNPLAGLTDYLRGGPAAEVAGVRTAMAAYVRFLAAIAPLVRAGVIVLVEPVSYPPLVKDDSYLEWRQPLARRVAATADFSDVSERALPSDARKYFAGSAIDVITKLLVAIDVHKNLDLYLPHGYFHDVLSAMGEPLIGVKAADSRLLTRLVQLKLPALRSLPLADLVALRDDGEAFLAWRADLRQALEATSRRAEDVELGADEWLGALREEMARSAIELDRRLARSGLAARARDGAKAFGLGAVIAGGAAAITGTATGLVSAGLALPVQLLWAYVASRRRRAADPDAALMHHYLLFRPGDAEQG